MTPEFKKGIYNNLPLYALDVEGSVEGVSAIALVDAPAIKKDFMKFREEAQLMKFAADEARRIVSGPVMIPDMPIYRKDDKANFEYYVVFTKAAVENIALKFAREGKQHNVNLMHDEAATVDGVYMFESFITDASRGIQPMKGFEDTPEGTWFASYKVTNDEVWKQVSSGEFKGFSVEGGFSFKPADQVEEVDPDLLVAARELLEVAEKLQS